MVSSEAVVDVTGKPLLRGVIHQVGFFVAIAAGAVLVLVSPTRETKLSALVFGVTLVNLFGTSALYHRVDWSTAARKRMRRLDHAAIFLLIAGGYTPLFALVPSASGGHGALSLIWVGGLLGVAKSLLWPNAPKPVTALLCVGLGWTVTGEVIARAATVGSLAIGLIIGSGVVYSLGALVYALKRPDPLPRVFGYHEVFHALVTLASGCLYAHALLVIRAVTAG